MRNIRPLPAVLAKKAADELNEDPNDIQFYLDALRHWLKRQRHLRSRTQDQFLVGFLRGSKFNVEKCKQKIDFFYTYRELMPELFKNRDAEDPMVCEILRMGSLLHLPQPIAEDGPRVVMLRLGTVDFRKYTTLDLFRVGSMMADLCLYDDDNAIVAGYIVIVDLANVTPYHLFHFDPLLIKKVTIMTNKSLPSRMKGFHFINMLPAFEKCFNMVRGVINDKLRNRFHFHGNDLTSLYKYVPRHCLPIEYGGKCDSIQDLVDHWETKLKKHKDFFIEEDSYGCDEKLREERTQAADMMFGIEGSFRKLNVD